MKIEVNQAFKPVFQSTARFNIIYGGAGSGKSYSTAQLLILTKLLSPTRRKVLILRKVANTIRVSVWPQILSLLSQYDLYSQCKVNKSEKTIIQGNNEFLFLGLDDVEKLKSIEGITDIWIEEASEITPDDFKQLNLRLRGGSGDEQMYITFNPISKLHWLKGHFFDVEQPNTYILKTTYKDNAFLSDEYRNQIESYKEIDPYYYQVYALGEWGEIGNVIFSNYSVKKVDKIDAPVYIGIDFGFNHPSAIILAQYVDGEVNVIGEFCARELTNTDLIAAAKDIVPAGCEVICDSAEPDRIEEFNRAGIYARAAAKGPGSLNAGIDWLKAHRINIDNSCTNLAKEVQGYKWIEDKDGNATDKPIPFNDDCIAALRYAIEPIRLEMGRAEAMKNPFWH